MVGGWRSGRERKLRTYSDPVVDDRELCAGKAVARASFFAARLSDSQPGRALVSAIHAAPAPAALRNFRRVSFKFESLFLPVATASGRYVEEAVYAIAGEHKQ